MASITFWTATPVSGLRYEITANGIGKFSSRELAVGAARRWVQKAIESNMEATGFVRVDLSQGPKGTASIRHTMTSLVSETDTTFVVLCTQECLGRMRFIGDTAHQDVLDTSTVEVWVSFKVSPESIQIVDDLDNADVTNTTLRLHLESKARGVT